MYHVQTEEARKPWLMGAGLAVALIAAAKLALDMYAGRHYGYFIDELYYLACARLGVRADVGSQLGGGGVAHGVDRARQPAPGLVYHSDRGVQYASQDAEDGR